VQQAQRPLLHNYVFPSAPRAQLVQKLVALAPPKLDMAYLLTTGSEAIECAIKLSRAWGHRVGGRSKNKLVSFEHAFHGRTLGAQQLGGTLALKEWIGTPDPDFHQVPSPVDLRRTDQTFRSFEAALAAQGVDPDSVAAVVSETVQGGNPALFPKEYVQKLAAWCERHGALLVFDEIQTAFGRTGRRFGFEHYDVVPDLISLGKAITSSIPLAAVLGRAEVLDQYPPGSMTSTHGGNPMCVAAALANLEIIEREGLIQNAERVGQTLRAELEALREQFPHAIAGVAGVGLVYGVHVVRDGTLEPARDLAFRTVEKAVQKGLLLFAPVGDGSATIKICPPLLITDEAIRDGAAALHEALAEALREQMTPVAAH
jgi:4-aminobutyrate aminotransferase-like enzyme